MGRMEEMEAQLKARMDALNARHADRMAALDARMRGQATPLEGSGDETKRSSSGNHAVCLKARSDVIGVDNVFFGYVQPSMTEVSQLFEYVRRAPVVQDNTGYAAIMNRTRFEYIVEADGNTSDQVNADAGLDERGEPVIHLFGGAARIGRVAALSIAAMEYGNDANAAQRFISTLTPLQCCVFSVADAIQVVNDAGLVGALRDDSVITKARTISAGLMLGIIAHEAGHLSLGHSFSQVNYYMSNMEVARNREREADSFASSVIATSPFGENVLLGTLLWWFVLSSQEGEALESTHPLSKERFENFVRANPDLAKSLGLGQAE